VITVDTVQAGRKWNGRKLYSITLSSRVGTVTFYKLTRRQAWRRLSEIVVPLTIEERPYKITGIKVL